MSTPAERRQVYSTRRWQKVRLEVLVRAGWLCESCRDAGFTQVAALVHHRLPIKAGGAAFDMQNLQALCRNCHESEHAVEKQIPEGVRAWGEYLSEILEIA